AFRLPLPRAGSEGAAVALWPARRRAKEKKLEKGGNRKNGGKPCETAINGRKPCGKPRFATACLVAGAMPAHHRQANHQKSQPPGIEGKVSRRKPRKNQGFCGHTLPSLFPPPRETQARSILPQCSPRDAEWTEGRLIRKPGK